MESPDLHFSVTADNDKSETWFAYFCFMSLFPHDFQNCIPLLYSSSPFHIGLAKSIFTFKDLF